MNPRIASIENLIAADPGERNIFGLVIADQLRLAAQTLRWARRVAIVSGFYIPDVSASETDGPPGAKVLGEALSRMGIPVDYLTDRWNARLFTALGLAPKVISDAEAVSTVPHSGIEYLNETKPTHLVSIERVGRGADGRYRDMLGHDISATTAPLDDLFLEAGRRGLTTIGIGDGGNEIGMGKVFAETLATIPHGARIASVVPTDYCIIAGVSNWGAYGLAGALSVLEGRDLLSSAAAITQDIERAVREGGAVDGRTHRREPTVDALDLAQTVRMVENIRRQIAPSPLKSGRSRLIAIVGFGETGQAAAALAVRRGHRVRISDEGSSIPEVGPGYEGVETGGHTIEFLGGCDLVVTSPGVRPDHVVFDALHQRGIPVMSELELAFQLCNRPLIAVTGTVGKRSTVELIERLFRFAGRHLAVGGNKGRPLSSLVLDDVQASQAREPSTPVAGYIAVAVSSFQLETVVGFRPHVAVMLNLSEAHLDRHRSLAEYLRIKSRIFMNHRPDDVLILNHDDPRVRAAARKHTGRTLFVSTRQMVDRGAYLLDGVIHVNLDGAAERIGAAAPVFPENLLAAVLTARLCGVSVEELRPAVVNLNRMNTSDSTTEISS